MCMIWVWLNLTVIRKLEIVHLTIFVTEVEVINVPLFACQYGRNLNNWMFVISIFPCTPWFFHFICGVSYYYLIEECCYFSMHVFYVVDSKMGYIDIERQNIIVLTWLAKQTPRSTLLVMTLYCNSYSWLHSVLRWDRSQRAFGPAEEAVTEEVGIGYGCCDRHGHRGAF